MQVPDGFGGARVRSPGPELTINIENVAGISIMLAAHVPSNTNNSPAVHGRFTIGSRPCLGGVALGCYGMSSTLLPTSHSPLTFGGQRVSNLRVDVSAHQWHYSHMHIEERPPKAVGCSPINAPRQFPRTAHALKGATSDATAEHAARGAGSSVGRAPAGGSGSSVGQPANA